MAERNLNRSRDGGRDGEPELSFEQSLEKLEQVVRSLEEGRLGLSDSLTQYGEGVKHLQRCYQALTTAERQIERLSGVDADGRPLTEPFVEESMSLEEKRDARSERRSVPTRRPAGRGTRPDRSQELPDERDDDVDVSGRLF